MYENYPKICIFSIFICIIASIFSPKESSWLTKKETTKWPIYESLLSWTGKSWNDSSKTATNTWNYASTGKLQWVYENPSCDAKCKVTTLIKLGMNEKIAWSLVYTCKEKAENPKHCIITWASILKAESNLWKKCIHHNCFWIASWRFQYETLEKWVEDWVKRYNKYWYKAKSASHFYPPRWWKSPSRYCTSEISSNSSVGCPNWQKHAQYMWNILSKKF